MEGAPPERGGRDEESSKARGGFFFHHSPKVNSRRSGAAIDLEIERIGCRVRRRSGATNDLRVAQRVGPMCAQPHHVLRSPTPRSAWFSSPRSPCASASLDERSAFRARLRRLQVGIRLQPASPPRRRARPLYLRRRGALGDDLCSFAPPPPLPPSLSASVLVTVWSGIFRLAARMAFW